MVVPLASPKEPREDDENDEGEKNSTGNPSPKKNSRDKKKQKDKKNHKRIHKSQNREIHKHSSVCTTTWVTKWGTYGWIT